MSRESLDQFVSRIADSEQLRIEIEGHLDNDGEISIDDLIELGTVNGCDFSVDDLQEAVELNDEELDDVSAGTKAVRFKGRTQTKSRSIFRKSKRGGAGLMMVGVALTFLGSYSHDD